MRLVLYGRFVDWMPAKYEVDQPIGVHMMIRRQQEMAAKTAGYEYYIIKDGHRVTIYDATRFEKLRALLLFAFKTDKKLILGERTPKPKENDIEKVKKYIR